MSPSNVSPRFLYWMIKLASKLILAFSNRAISSLSRPFSFIATSRARSSSLVSNGGRADFFQQFIYLFICHLFLLIDNFDSQIGEDVVQGVLQAVAVSVIEFDRDVAGLALADGLDVTDISV